MSSKLHLGRLGCLRTPRCYRATLSAMVAVSLAALPTASALASSGASEPAIGVPKRSARAVQPLATPGELLPAGELEALLSRLPIGDLSTAQLAHYLAALEGIDGLAGLEMGLLSGKHLGAQGLEESLREAIKQLGPTATLGELAHAEDLLPALEAALEGKLGGLLEVLLGALPGAGPGLESALGSLNLDQLVGSLLSSAKSEELPLKEELLTKLSTLAEGLFGELGAEGKLEGLLGSKLTGGFTPKSVKEVAEKLKTTSKSVSEELGQTTEQLPESATMLTAPLTNGKLAGIAPAVKGLALGVLGDLGEGLGGKGPSEEGKGSGGSGEGKGSGSGSGEGNGKGSGEGNGSGGAGSGGGGGQGGPGGTGSGGSAGTTTILLTLPGASATQTTAAAQQKKPGKISILSHRVRGHVATIVLSVPGAGTATLTGKDLRTVGRQAAKAERLTLKVSLSGAGIASLGHGRHHRLRVKLKASFKPADGPASSETATVAFAS